MEKGPHGLLEAGPDWKHQLELAKWLWVVYWRYYSQVGWD
jgi:hypothetical protein